MIVRTYTAELTGPTVEVDDTGVVAVRRLRAWCAEVETPWGTFAFRRGSAVPAAVDLHRSDSRPQRIPIRNPEAPMLAAAKAMSTLGSSRAKRGKR